MAEERERIKRLTIFFSLGKNFLWLIALITISEASWKGERGGESVSLLISTLIASAAEEEEKR